ncbi:hypothetical protein F5050DRAFT_1808006 [Lentinula boryana]|uniref:Uncharacterized protein n=1 Tax=Lentinula boryana TaxID=40481 RepID=A0ABQ8QC91_9AGAR|nr:hypothetical protein F5050DRAFT_1808006 [Lentinula boryana]
MSTFLSIPNNLDMLALSSASSSSISSSLSFFESKHSSDSQTDISPPASPLDEDADKDCTHRRRLTGCFLDEYDEHWDLETPMSNLGDLFSPVLKKDQESLAADEAGYEAEASDGDEAPVFVLSGDRKKRLVKPKPKLGHCAEPNIESMKERSELWTLPPKQSVVAQDRKATSPPIKPVLRPQLQNLNSPSPIIALPSPRSHNQFPNLPWNLPSSSSINLLSSSQAAPIIDRARRNTAIQKPLGLGLRIPGMLEQQSGQSGHSIEMTASSSSDRVVEEKGVTLIGLGIQLPADLPSASLSNSSPSIDSVSVKRQSFSGLGYGLPPTRGRGHSTRLGPLQSTVRLVTPTEHVRDSEPPSPTLEQVSEHTAPGLCTVSIDVRQRRAAIALKPCLSSSHFSKRRLYPILEFNTITTTTTSPSTSPHFPSTSNRVSNSQIKKKLPSFYQPENQISFAKRTKSASSSPSNRKTSSSLCSSQCSTRLPLQQKRCAFSFETDQYFSTTKDDSNMFAKTLF